MQKRLNGLILLIILFSGYAFSQQDDVYQKMTLEELMDIEVVVSASKKPEDLFEAPLSVTIIRREEIMQLGITSIPEALRLAPGMIVREQTPGNYDVHIRGFDDVTRSFIMPTPVNSITLVMIDNRIVYNYFAGGTFWEALPIDIHDIDRIEVVRGPASALYGPNAAAGVIHIITRKPEQAGFHTDFNASFGTLGAKNVTGGMEYLFNDKFCWRVSGNCAYRERSDAEYFTWLDQRYVSINRLTSLMLILDPETGMPMQLYESYMMPEYDVDRALDKYGINSFLSYKPSAETHFDLSLGTQRSVNQKAYYNNFSTPLSEYTSTSTYIDLKGQYKRFNGQLSYIQGKHDNNIVWNIYDFQTIDATLEYDWQTEKWNLRPGLSFRESRYGAMLLIDECWTEEYFENRIIPDEKRIISANAFSLLGDYRPSPSLRLISGLRFDKYNVSDELSITYEAAVTYRFNKRNLGRLSFSKANRAPFMLDTYIGGCVSVPFWAEWAEMPGEVRFKRNQDTGYLTNKVLELGWRTKVTPKLNLDCEVYSAWMDDILNAATNEAFIDSIKYGTPFYVLELEFRNSDLYISQQFGAAFNLDYKMADNLRINLYSMVQKETVDYDDDDLEEMLINDYLLSFGSIPSRVKMDSLKELTKESVSRSTPRFFGGCQINYTPLPRFSLNFNAYWMSRQIFEGIDIEYKYSQRVPASAIINAKLGYQFMENGEIYFSARNVLGTHREYAFTDRIVATYLMGLRWGF